MVCGDVNVCIHSTHLTSSASFVNAVDDILGKAHKSLHASGDLANSFVRRVIDWQLKSMNGQTKNNRKQKICTRIFYVSRAYLSDPALRAATAMAIINIEVKSMNIRIDLNEKSTSHITQLLTYLRHDSSVRSLIIKKIS